MTQSTVMDERWPDEPALKEDLSSSLSSVFEGKHFPKRGSKSVNLLVLKCVHIIKGWFCVRGTPHLHSLMTSLVLLSLEGDTADTFLAKWGKKTSLQPMVMLILSPLLNYAGVYQ